MLYSIVTDSNSIFYQILIYSNHLINCVKNKNNVNDPFKLHKRSHLDIQINGYHTSNYTLKNDAIPTIK